MGWVGRVDDSELNLNVLSVSPHSSIVSAHPKLKISLPKEIWS